MFEEYGEEITGGPPVDTHEGAYESIAAEKTRLTTTDATVTAVETPITDENEPTE